MLRVADDLYGSGCQHLGVRLNDVQMSLHPREVARRAKGLSTARHLSAGSHAGQQKAGKGFPAFDKVTHLSRMKCPENVASLQETAYLITEY